MSAGRTVVVAADVPCDLGFWRSTAGRYVRVEIRNADGDVIGFSKPVWILREEPPGGIPAGRRGGHGQAR